MNVNKSLVSGLSALAFITLTGCSNNNSTASQVSTQTYRLALTNLTPNQPFSPLNVAIHDSSYKAWEIGAKSSLGLETLAESGDGSTFLAESVAAGAFKTKSGAAPVLPGESGTLEIESAVNADMTLTLASMLVNTNDAFTGLSSVDISGMNIGESMTWMLPVYDAGTEGNNELTGTIPGPADGGEGFNVVRDDVDFVSRHPGVVSSSDGYASSILDSTHRFDGPVAKLVLTRTL